MSHGYSLASLGWDRQLQEAFTPHAARGHEPARVATQHRDRYALVAAGGPSSANVAGRLRHSASGAAQLPAVGDWVAVATRRREETATIHAVLPRRSAFTRKVAGEESEPQVLAANMDVIFIVTSLNADLNVRRLERYLTMAYESGAEPVIVLTKADLAHDLSSALDSVSSVAIGVPVHVVSAITGEGMADLETHLQNDRTGVLLGSSGVGKSTLVNTLAGRDLAKVQEIREDDDKGRHTTTSRELIVLPRGGMVIDTPGIRELQLWHAESGLSGSFPDIETLASRCRFNDCSHETEPGCAVSSALDAGTLSTDRLAAYRKLQRELRHLEMKTDRRLASEETRKWKVRHKAMRKMNSPKV